MKLELGTLQMTIEFKNGEVQHGTPRLDVLQNNIKEVAPHVPDGTYKWTLTLDVDTATRETPETETCPVCKNEVPADSMLSYNNVPNAFCQQCVDSGRV